MRASCTLCRLFLFGSCDRCKHGAGDDATAMCRDIKPDTGLFGNGAGSSETPSPPEDVIYFVKSQKATNVLRAKESLTTGQLPVSANRSQQEDPPGGSSETEISYEKYVASVLPLLVNNAAACLEDGSLLLDGGVTLGSMATNDPLYGWDGKQAAAAPSQGVSERSGRPQGVADTYRLDLHDSRACPPPA